ncbi:MAG TPA: spore coat U domain-containing protein [Aromatoleum sp.]|uniref:Csu type fimbrial protein n=1 Tax=Aromatoleum sp. TaxID=2307007 RepID=UPI002B497A6A|nr:spore coat U domain-containing protein [Aromatoleum sp.]HJV24992.1 spore coat U domain-containing protein [Aromatoleum sp.]
MRLRALVLVLQLVAGPAFGQTSSCTASASATNFGTYSPTSPSALDGTGNVQVSCSLLGIISILVSYQIQLSAGASGSSAGRTLAGPGASLNYNLYTNASRTAIWGDGSGGSSTVSDGYLLGLLTTVKNYPVFGRIVAGQNVPSGSYSDTIVVTVNY